MTIEVYADNVPAPGIGAFSIDVLYPTKNFEQTDCRSNVAYCGSFPAEGRTRLAGAIAQGATGRVVFAEITYHAHATRPMTVEIQFVVNQLASPQSQELDASTENALISITGAVPTIVARLGDTDCDGEVDAADAIGPLREAAGLSAPPCAASGDVDCDGDRDSVDALAILRHAASLPPGPQHEPCPDIGTPT